MNVGDKIKRTDAPLAALNFPETGVILQINPAIIVEWEDGTKSIFTSKQAFDYYCDLNV